MREQDPMTQKVMDKTIADTLSGTEYISFARTVYNDKKYV